MLLDNVSLLCQDRIPCDDRSRRILGRPQLDGLELVLVTLQQFSVRSTTQWRKSMKVFASCPTCVHGRVYVVIGNALRTKGRGLYVHSNCGIEGRLVRQVGGGQGSTRMVHCDSRKFPRKRLLQLCSLLNKLARERHEVRSFLTRVAYLLLTVLEGARVGWRLMSMSTSVIEAHAGRWARHVPFDVC